MVINNFLLDISLEILSFDQLENENWVQLYGVICNLQPVRKIIYMCVVNVGQIILKSLPWVPETFLARFPVSVKSV